jgi:hypothetical protein
MKTQVCVLSLSHSLCLSYTQATKRPTSGDGPVQGMSASYRNVTGRLHPSNLQLLITLFKSGVAHNIPFHLFPSSRPHHQLVPPPQATRYVCESRSARVCVCVCVCLCVYVSVCVCLETLGLCMQVPELICGCSTCPCASVLLAQSGHVLVKPTSTFIRTHTYTTCFSHRRLTRRRMRRCRFWWRRPGNMCVCVCTSSEKGVMCVEDGG